MATRIDDVTDTVTFTFNGQEIETQAGDTVAAALALAGQRHFRDSVVSGEPRGFYCMMGTCFDCLIEVDGITNVQACRTLVADGMTVTRQTQNEETI